MKPNRLSECQPRCACASRAVIISSGTTLRVEMPETRSLKALDGRKLEEVERDYIIKALEETNWRISGDHGAALLLGLHPNTLRSRMDKLGIRRLSTKPEGLKNRPLNIASHES